MSNNAQFTLHTHPRDKRVAVFDKEYQVVYVLFSWYHKCLKLEEPAKSYVTKDESLYVYLKAKAPHVLSAAAKEEENTVVDGYLLMDMLALYPNDEWLLNLEKTLSPFRVHVKNDKCVALECTKTHEIFIPYEMYYQDADINPVAIDGNKDMSTEKMCSFLYIHFPDQDDFLGPPICTLDFMLTKFPKDKWLLKLKKMQEELVPKKNPHYDLVCPEDLFTLIRHPRDGRICVDNKLSQVKLFPVKWFKKCLNLPRGRNALFSNHTTNQVRHFLAENAPEIFEGKKPWNAPTFTLEDMLVLYPKDKWLLELSGEGDVPLDSSSIEEDVLLEEEKPKKILSKIQKKKNKKEKKPQKTIIPFKKRERQEEGEEEGDSLRSLAKKWKQECVDRNLEHWKQEFIAEHKAQWRQEYERSHQDDWNKEGQEFARREVVEFLMSKIKE